MHRSSRQERNGLKILVLGGGSDQVSLIQELKKRDAHIVLIDYYKNPVAKQYADKHYVMSTLDFNAILDVARTETVSYVMTACIDQALLSMAYVAERLSLPCPLSYEKALVVTNKNLMKKVMVRAGIPTSRHLVVKRGGDTNPSGLRYPLVVKPADANGSYGVKKVRAPDELSNGLHNALAISRSGQAIIEEFREGVEISVDAFIKDGKTKLLMMSTSRKLRDADAGFPIFQSRYPTNIGPEIESDIEKTINRIGVAFCLDNTPLLVQLIYAHGEINVIEFGVRIAGGSKHHFIKEITNFDIMSSFVQSYFNEDFSLDTAPTVDHVSMNYVYTKPGIFGELQNADRLRQSGIIKDYYIYKTPGMRTEGCCASRDRICSFMVRASSEAEMDVKIRYAAEQMRVLNGSGEDFMLRSMFR